jgi:hypothetical protein
MKKGHRKHNFQKVAICTEEEEEEEEEEENLHIIFLH